MMNCKLNTCYLKSCDAIACYTVLGTGGGVFGILARNGMMDTSSTRAIVGEALLWVAVFAWITTFFDFIFNAFGKKLFETFAQMVFHCMLFDFYLAAMIAWAVRGTFDQRIGESLIVFILALLTTLGYFWLMMVSLSRYYKERMAEQDKNKKEDALVENGKADKVTEEKEAPAEQTQEEAKTEE